MTTKLIATCKKCGRGIWRFNDADYWRHDSDGWTYYPSNHDPKPKKGTTGFSFPLPGRTYQ